MSVVELPVENRAEIEKAHPGLIDWLLTGERGLSSETIVKLVLGIPLGKPWGNSTPLDAGDFRRCALLFKAVPTLRPFLDTVIAESDPAWSLFARDWDLLQEIFIASIPNYLSTNPEWNRGNLTLHEEGYKLMKRIRKSADDIRFQ